MKYPVVIPLHSKGGKFKNNTEARYAVRSIAKNVMGDIHLAIVSSRLPDWAEGIELIPDGQQGLKTALLKSAERFPDGFFWWYDDCCLLQPESPQRIQGTPAIPRFGGTENTKWSKMLGAVRKRLDDEGIHPIDYSRPHGPYWFTKDMIDEAFADWPDHMTGKFPFETWILSKRKWPYRTGIVKQYYGPFRNPPGKQVFLNYNDQGNTSELREWLDGQFGEKCRYEKEECKPRIEFVKRPRRLAVSMSLYGENPVYAVGAIENTKLASALYPDSAVVVHAERGHYAIDKLRCLGAEVIEHEPEKEHVGMRWRFETGDDPDYEAVIFRDADSRIGPKEVAAVNAWLDSGKSLHTIHDHRKHRKPIMGGMWGIRQGALSFKDLLSDWRATGKYGDDEAMLAARVWPALKNSHMGHGRKRLPFPDHAPVTGFIGERVDPSFKSDECRVVLLTAEHYAQRRERFLDGMRKHGGFINKLPLEVRIGTPVEKTYCPTSFKDLKIRKHWWAASCDHLAVIEESLVAGHQHLLFLEDDAMFQPNFNDLFWKAWCALPNDWRALRLGWREHNQSKELVKGVLHRCDEKGGGMNATLWNHAGLVRFYDHAWHRRKMVIDMAFADLRKYDPVGWYQPAEAPVLNDPLAVQQGNDK